MRLLRLLLVVLLSLGVTSQGYASVEPMDAACPMLQAAAPLAAHHDMAHGMAHDMSGMEHGHDHGQHDGSAGADQHAGHCACVAGAQPASAPPDMARCAAAWVVMQPAPGAGDPAFQSHHCFRHWRPPALP
ncbi:MAG: hypothetical protein ABW278_05740 [Steroidobacteraceae bacterium]